MHYVVRVEENIVLVTWKNSVEFVIDGFVNFVQNLRRRDMVVERFAKIAITRLRIHNLVFLIIDLFIYYIIGAQSGTLWNVGAQSDCYSVILYLHIIKLNQ